MKKTTIKSKTVNKPKPRTKMSLRPKKYFKLGIMGLINWETHDWTFKEIAVIMLLVMAFVAGMIWMLKIYALPTLGGPVAFNMGRNLLQKYIKPRGP